MHFVDHYAHYGDMYGSDEYGSDEYGEYGSDEYGEYEYYNDTSGNDTVSDMGRAHPGQDKMLMIIEDETFDSKFGLTA